MMKMGGRPVTIRTFDVREEKPAAGSPGRSSGVRGLDWRLVLESAPMQQVFHQQVRAILRCGAFGPVRMLVPLVGHSEVLDLTRSTMDRAREELRREGLEDGRGVLLGAMIETPAAVPLAETWASEVDFFALGTNDLTASCLGIDRNHPVGSSGPGALHPGVFHLIRYAVEAAHRCHRPVTVCGELAASPEGAIALAALQVDALSVAVHHLLAVRRRLQHPPPPTLVAQLATARTTRQMSEILRQWLPEEPGE